MKESAQGAASRSNCPINVALEIFGDRWSLLIIRDMMFRGWTTYSQFLGAEEGISTNILADRLRKLAEAGIIGQKSSSGRGGSCYRLTSRGIALAPVLVEIVLWSVAQETTSAPPAVIRRIKRDKAAFVADIHRAWKGSGPPVFG